MKIANVKAFVMDCSITMAWVLPGEANAGAEAVLQLLETAHIKVPTIWPLEVNNVLLQAEHRKRISTVEVAEFKEFLAALPIYVDDTTGLHAAGSIYTLAKEQHLTIYDAAYLELSMRENLPLATLDKALQKAAMHVGIQVFK